MSSHLVPGNGPDNYISYLHKSRLPIATDTRTETITVVDLILKEHKLIMIEFIHMQLFSIVT